MPEETLFLTGFPGFIASRLLQRLVASPCRFILLVQPGLVKLAHSQIESIAGKSGRNVDDFRIILGDITQPQLGLDPTGIELLKETTRILHLAAIYDLAV